MKFRVRCNNTNEIMLDMGNMLRCDGAVVNLFSGEVINNVTIERFTGQEDRNGVEIYEGDVVKETLGGTGVVKYVNSSFRICTSGFGVLLMGKFCEVIK